MDDKTTNKKSTKIEDLPNAKATEQVKGGAKAIGGFQLALGTVAKFFGIGSKDSSGGSGGGGGIRG